nr:myristylated membrane protein [Wadden Sea poxvirus]
MGSGVSITNMKIQHVNEREKKLYLFFNDIKHNKVIKFVEENKIYDNESMNEINPQFCLTNNLDIENCGNFLSTRLSKKYILVKGNSCRSFIARPGSLILYENGINEKSIDEFESQTLKYISKGIRCKFIKNDFNITDSEFTKCCIKPSNNCPTISNNNYETNHCDKIMVNFCNNNPNNVNCMKWLRQRRTIALNTYSNICSKNMDERYCSEFIKITRPDFFHFGDIALINFCKIHNSNRNCWCVNPPNNSKIDNIEKYLGPRVCWLRECTTNNKDRKWLLYDQDIQRSKCKYTGCNININSLILNNAHADLVADCSGNNNIISDINPGLPKKNKNVIIPFFNIHIIVFIIIILVLFYFTNIYSINKIKTNVINVRRK